MVNGRHSKCISRLLSGAIVYASLIDRIGMQNHFLNSNWREAWLTGRTLKFTFSGVPLGSLEFCPSNLFMRSESAHPVQRVILHACKGVVHRNQRGQGQGHDL